MAESTESQAEPSGDFPIPPATFPFLIESILMQAQIQLGLLTFGEKEDDSEPNLPLARHSIDMLAMLQEKTRGNLTVEEQRLLDNGLTELRFRFVQISEETNRRKSSKAASASTSDAPTSDDRPLIITADGGKGTKTD